MKTFKKLFSIALALLLTISLVACKNNSSTTKAGTTTNTTKKVIDEVEGYVLPQVSNPDTVVFTGANGIEASITKDQIYKMIKHHAGIDLLVDMIDNELLKDEIAALTAADIEAQIAKLTYGDLTQDEIDALTDEEKAEYEAEAQNNFKLLGFDSDEEKAAFAKLAKARENYTRTYIKNNKDDKKSLFYINDETLENYYKTNGNKNTVNAIIIPFNSGEEFINTLKTLNLVVFNSKIQNCTLDPISYSKLSSDNCTELTDADVLNTFVSLYEMTTGATTTTEGTAYTYNELAEISSTLAAKVFELENGKYFYTPKVYTVGYGSTLLLVYRVSGEAQAEYDTLEDAKKEELLDSYIETLINTSNISRVLGLLRSENELTIYDKYFGMDYASGYDSSYNYKLTEGDNTKLASITNKEFTCDDLYNYAYGINPRAYEYYAAIKDIAKTYESYNLIYSTKSDVRYEAFTKEVQDDIDANFQSSTFDTTNEYLYNKYGFSNIADVVEYSKVYADAVKLALLDEIFEEVEIPAEPSEGDSGEGDGTTDGEGGEEPLPTYKVQVKNDYQDKFNEVLNDLYDNYYNVKAWQVIIYTDKDVDFNADDMEALTATDTTTLNAAKNLIAEIADFIASATNTDDAIEKINEFIELYNGSAIDGEYSEYKTLGLKVKYSVISSTAINYASKGSTYTNAINNALKELYAQVKADGFNDGYYVVSDIDVIDENGIHFVFGKEGSTSKKPSFKYVNVSSSVNKLSKNENDKISLDQLTGAFYVYLYKSLLTNASTAKDTYEIDTFPLSMASSLDFSSYTSALEKYFVSDNFTDYLLSLKLGDDFGNLSSAFEYILNK